MLCFFYEKNLCSQQSIYRVSLAGDEATAKDPEDSGFDTSMEMSDYRLTGALPFEYGGPTTATEEEREEEEEAKFITRKQADLFIARQSRLLHYAENAALGPQDLQEELLVVLRSNPGLQEAHFLSYLNCLRLKEVVGAVDSLYAASNQSVIAGQSKLSLEEVNKSYRYAGLNLASLHARLGHVGEALAAVRESITIAQEARDHVCLQHALSWISRYSSNSMALLERCVAKCEHLGLPYLASLAMLGLCAFVEEFGQRPGHVLDLLTRSSVLNCKNDLTELQAGAFVTRASVWTSFGRPRLAVTVSQLLLQLNTAERGHEGQFYQGEPLVMALANLALHLDAEGYGEEADSVLDLAEKQYPCPASQHAHIWQVAKYRIVYVRATRAANWAAAEQAVAFLACHVTDAEFLGAELRFKQGDLTGARDILRGILEGSTGCQESPPAGASSVRRELLVRCLLLLADLHTASNDTGL